MSRFIRKTNYHTLDGVESEISETVAASVAPAEVVEIGVSTEGRSIKAVCFGDGDFRKPEVLYFALTHSMEFIGSEAALALISHFAGGGHAEILNRMNVWTIPVLNPDGYASVEKQLDSALGIGFGRKNARGVDLNRNFPVAFYHFPRSLFAGSPTKASPYFKGDAPCSETESAMFRDFVLGRNFKVSLTLHSFGAVILFPYNHTPIRCRDYDTFVDLGKDMSDAQRRPYSVKQSYELYAANGSISDWLYDECGILAFVMEIGKFGAALDRPETWLNPFYWYNPAEPRDEIDNIMPAALRLAERSLSLFTP